MGAANGDRPSPALSGAALLGAAVALCAFAAESALIVRSGAIGLEIDTEGPFAALMAVVRPRLPLLLSRVALAYLGAGAFLGLAAGLLARSLDLRRRWLGRAVFTGEMAILLALLLWHRAITRPALFDDLPPALPLLQALVDEGDPLHPLLALAALLLAHACAAWFRFGFRTTRPLHAAAGAAMVAALLFTPSLPVPKPHEPRVTSAREFQKPRLVLMVGMDAFRPDRLAVYGGSGAVAPHLEAFLSEATRFDRAYTPIAQTEPAFRSLLTARWPFATGVRYPLTADSRREELPTFPSILAQHGHRTVFATDCSRFNFQDERSGFSERLQPPRGALNFALEKLRYRGPGIFLDNAAGAAFLPELIENRGLAGLYDPHGYARRLARRITAAAEAGPTMFLFHSTAAHFPGDPVYPHYRRFVARTEPLERRLRMFFAPVGKDTPGPSGWGRRQSEALYDELLSQADAQLGILLEELRSRGLYRDALVIVFSDHGESFHSDAPHLAGTTPVHGARLSEEESRILLAIKPPGGRVVERVGDLVRLIDLGPTLLELAGAPPLPGASGVSLLPRLRGVPSPPLTLYAETGFTHVSPDALDPLHAAGAPRSFQAYRVRPDGVVELTEQAHRAVLEEKDIGAFDGAGWLIRAPRKDGTVLERCSGICAPSLRTFLDQQQGFLARRDHG